jgi:hypothetical protein
MPHTLSKIKMKCLFTVIPNRSDSQKFITPRSTPLIGIDPDYWVHVSDRLLSLNDGPMLEALKLLNSKSVHLPGRIKDRPDWDRLALRFERFKVVHELPGRPVTFIAGIDERALTSSLVDNTRQQSQKPSGEIA